MIIFLSLGVRYGTISKDIFLILKSVLSRQTPQLVN